MLPHWGIAFFFLTAVFSFGLYRRGTPWQYCATLFYLLTMSNAVICFRELGVIRIGPGPTEVFLLAAAGFSVYAVLTFAFAGAFVSPKACWFILEEIYPFICLFGALLHFSTGVKLIPHASSHATFIALGIPYLVPKSRKNAIKKVFGILLMATSVIYSDASSPIGVLCVVMASYMVFHRHFKWLFLSAVPLVAAVLFYGPQRIFNDTDRFKAYRFFMGEWWRDSWEINLFGFGPGTFEMLSQIQQLNKGFMIWVHEGRLRGYNWMHMHSDLLQFVWEYGLIGAALLACCVWRLWKDLDGYTNERAVLIGCLSAMIFDFPFRYPGVPVILFLLIGLSSTRHLPSPNSHR